MQHIGWKQADLVPGLSHKKLECVTIRLSVWHQFWLSSIWPSLFTLCSSDSCKLHTHTQPFNSRWSGTTRVGRYQKKHSPTHTHLDHQTSFINFLHLPRSILCVQFTCLTVLFDNLSPGLLLGLGPSTSYSMHFFIQSSSSFRRRGPYHCSVFCCNTNAVSSIPSLSLSSLLGNLS